MTFYDEATRLTGSFVITDATFYKDGLGNYQLGSFSATYDQTSATSTSHVSGSINYTASGFAVPEPSSAMLLGVAGVVGMGLR